MARQRLLGLRLVAPHKLSAAQIAAAVEVSRATVFNYGETVAGGGVAARLQRGPSGGLAPTLAGDDQVAFVAQLRAGKFRRAKEAPAWIRKRTQGADSPESSGGLAGRSSVGPAWGRERRG